jgi:hypothetical protein
MDGHIEVTCEIRSFKRLTSPSGKDMKRQGGLMANI